MKQDEWVDGHKPDEMHARRHIQTGWRNVTQKVKREQNTNGTTHRNAQAYGALTERVLSFVSLIQGMNCSLARCPVFPRRIYSVKIININALQTSLYRTATVFETCSKMASSKYKPEYKVTQQHKYLLFST